MIRSSSFFKSLLNLGSFDLVISGKVSKPILKPELMVVPPILSAAMPVGATTIIFFSNSAFTASSRVVLPVPAAPVK